MNKIHVTLISGRTTQQGIGLEIGKLSDEYFESVSYIELNDGDANILEIEEKQLVQVKTEFGSVVVSTRLSDRIESGLAFIPYGPWANMVFDSSTEGTGMPSFKGINAEITKADGENVPTLEELIEVIKEGV